MRRRVARAGVNRRRFLTGSAGATLGLIATRSRAAGDADLQAETADPIKLFLCGDVMTGRGVDQVLPQAGDPRIYERYMRSALGYVELAEAANGPVPAPVDVAYIWGDALAALEAARPDVRIVNLETSVTSSDDYLP